MASSKCSIDACKRASDILCDHCQAQVCTKHYIEHIREANNQLEPFSNELNSMFDILKQQRPLQRAFQQLDRWREQSHQRIDAIYEQKKQQIEHDVTRLMEMEMKKLRDLSSEIEELIKEGDASFKQITSTKARVDLCREKCQGLDEAAFVVSNVDSVPWEASITVRKSILPPFQGDGRLLSDEHQLLLNDWVGKEDQKWKLVYKATRDGFDSAQFHRLCNNVGPTITVVESKDGKYLFGGYTSLAWKSISGYGNDPTNSFLFTLTNPHQIPPTKYKIVHPQYAIYDHVNYGPTFGGGHDIYLCTGSDKNGICTVNFPHSYTDSTGRGALTFTGQKSFQANEIEVYRLIDSN